MLADCGFLIYEQLDDEEMTKRYFAPCRDDMRAPKGVNYILAVKSAEKTTTVSSRNRGCFRIICLRQLFLLDRNTIRQTAASTMYTAMNASFISVCDCHATPRLVAGYDLYAHKLVFDPSEAHVGYVFSLR